MVLRYMNLGGLLARIVVKSGYPKDTCYDEVGRMLRLYRDHFKFTKALPLVDPS
jgi:hypothetical protein